MSKTVLSILLFVLGLIIGLVIIKVLEMLKGKTSEKKADSIIDNAKKEAEKLKRTSLFEAKEESYVIWRF